MSGDLTIGSTSVYLAALSQGSAVDPVEETAADEADEVPDAVEAGSSSALIDLFADLPAAAEPVAAATIESDADKRARMTAWLGYIDVKSSGWENSGSDD